MTLESRTFLATSRLVQLTRLAAATAIFAAASAADARTVRVKWDHDDAVRVDHYLVFSRDAGQAYAAGVRVDAPPVGADGAFFHDLSVSDGVDVLTAVKAVDGSGESNFSNDRLFPAVAADPAAVVYESDGFGALAVGDDPAGWVDTAANNSLSEDDSLFGVLDVGGNRVFGTTSTSAHIHSHYTAGGAPSLSSYEYSGRMRIGSASGGIGITTHSQYLAEDAYYRLLRSDSESFAIRRHPSGAAVACADDDTGVVPQADTWYRFRFQVLPEASGTQINAKVWRQGDAEPAGWQVDCFDDLSSRLSAGTFGMWTSQAGGKYWDDLRVTDLGAGGDPDPDPPPDPPPPDPPEELGQPGKPTLQLP